MVTRVYWRRRGPLSIEMKPNKTLLAIFIDVDDVIVDICSGLFANFRKLCQKGKWLSGIPPVGNAVIVAVPALLFHCSECDARQCRVQDCKVGDVIEFTGHPINCPDS